MNHAPAPSPEAGAALPPPRTIAAWRVLLRGAGVLVALFVFCFWAAKGYNRGWTKNQVAMTKTDPITEIDYVEYEKRFVPGVDYLAGGAAVGLLIFAVTFIPGRGPKKT